MDPTKNYDTGIKQVELTGRDVTTTQPAALQNLVNTTAGTSKFFNDDGSLNPQASKRVIGVVNKGNQSVTVQVQLYLKAIGNDGSNVSVTSSSLAAGQTWFVSNGQLNEIDAPWDSVGIGVNYATLPSSGGVDVVIQESI